MATNSTTSFGTRLYRFKNGVTLINNWTDYSPSNPLLAKSGLNDFVY